MKTDDLILLLASDTVALQPRVWRRRYALALAAGIIGAVLLMFAMLGVRCDIAVVAQIPAFWVKFAFPGALAAAALMTASRLSRPGVPLGLAAWLIPVPLLAIWTLGIVELTGAAPAQRDVLFWGGTWATCPVYVALLSVPTFIAMLWVMKTLAPTQLARAGAAAGLVAGAVGAMAYALYCPESGASFLGVWYVIGMLIPTTLGAAIGPRVLRW
jgi:hypothetical protein